jgi:hypothetical protein
MVGQLFDGSGILLQGVASVLGPCLQLVVISCGQVLVPKSFLNGFDRLLLPPLGTPGQQAYEWFLHRRAPN